MIRLARGHDGHPLEMARPGRGGTPVAHTDVHGTLTQTLCGLTGGQWERPAPDSLPCPRCRTRHRLLLASTPPRRWRTAA